MARRTTRSPDVELPDAGELERLKLSPEVAWYLASRGMPLPDCPPAIKTPDPGEAPGARFDPDRVDKVLKVFGLLRHTKGKWARQKTPLKPDPWQVAYILAPIFGWVAPNDDGVWVRVVREAYVDLPRKNGKTTTAGGIAVYLTTADDEPGAEVYAAASGKDQARYCFDPVKTLAEKSPALAPHVRALASKIVHRRTGSYFAVVSKVADLLHGANVHGAIVDELHVHADAGLVDTITTGTGSRDQPLVFIITTADDGRPGTIYARKRHYVEQLARRVFTDPTTYGVVWAAAKSDDPFDAATWRKANPGYGISPTREYMRSAAAKARQSPAELASFLRLHLGIRTKQETRYIDLPTWDASAGMVDEQALAGRDCYGGLDLSSVHDMTALTWDFPDGEDGHDVVWRFWLPEERLPDLNRRTAGEAEVWVREGWLELTPGNVIDDDAILARIDRDAQRFHVLTVGHDRWGATNVVRRLTDSGLTCVGVGQGFASLNAPMKDLLRLLLSRRYRHGGNPVMRWMVDNLAVRLDPAGNVKPDKSTSGDLIDGVSAAVTALREYLDDTSEEEQDSIYEDADLEFG